MIKRILSTVFCFSLVLIVVGQKSRAELENERRDIQRQIEQMNNTLNETKKNRKETLKQLAVMQRKLKLRERAIRNINDQINVIDAQMNQSWRDILRLRKELDTLKLQYEKSVVYAYKNRSNYDFLNFIFSATNFNDALKRVSYMKSYRNYREQQAENINHAQTQLNDRLAGLKVHRNAKNSVLKEENQERAVLVAEKKEKDAVNAKLRSREKELTKDLALKKRQDANLKNSIAAAIKREIAAETKKQEAIAKAEAARNPSSSNTDAAPKVTKPKTFSVFDNTAEGKALSENFEKNRNKLPWPVEEGNVSMEFGPQKVLEGSNIVYNNQGLTFETKAGTPVKVVFDGEVSSVFNADDATAVIVRHGKYFSSYSGLSSVNVQKGQMVKTGQTLGRVNEKSDGIGQLEFIIMTDKLVNLSPRQWLR